MVSARSWRRWAVVAVVVGLCGFPIPAAASHLVLLWGDNNHDERGVIIERREASEARFTEIATIGADLPFFVDAAVNIGSDYCYRLRSFNTTYISEYTPVLCATAPADGSTVMTVGVNHPALRASDTLDLSVSAVSGAIASPVDAYVIVQGGGTMFSLQLDGRLVPGIVPLAQGIVLPSASGGFRFPLATAPRGQYTWVAFAAEPGTLSPVAPMSAAPFTVLP